MRNAILAMAIGLLTCPALAGPDVAASANEKTGPIGEKTPPAKWGACVYDEHNQEWFWFGGVGGVSETGALGTWTFKDGKWTALPLPAPSAEAKKAAAAVEKARNFYAAVANRYYRSEMEAAAKVDLRSLAPVEGDVPFDGLDKAVALEHVGQARKLWQALVVASWQTAAEPPARSYPSMVYDAKTKSIVLFGGEGIHGQYNDTWVYDCTKKAWRNAGPKLAPPPRMAGGLVARDGTVYLAGGLQIRDTTSYMSPCWQLMPTDLWKYDIAANTWTRLAAGESKEVATRSIHPLTIELSGDGKTLSWNWVIYSYGKKKGERSGTFDLAKLADTDADTAKAALPSDTIRPHGLAFDPAWYEQDVPPVDPDAVAKKLAELPANKWVDMAPPKTHFNRDWGTAVLDLRGDQILHWAGGHSAYCGTGVAHYSPATNRWHILYQPELPFEHIYGNSTSPSPSMSGRPWAEHTYLSVAWDQVTGKMLYLHDAGFGRLTNPSGVWVYDPAAYEWSAPGFKIAKDWFDIERHKTCTVRTPHGVATWGDKRGGSGGQSGLWMLDTEARVFNPVAATDKNDRTTYPHSAYGDAHGMTWDSKRNRVLMFHFGQKDKHKIWATDLESGKVTVLEPKNGENFPPDASMGREATYIPDFDVVIVPTRGKPAQHTLVYDCTANAWLRLTRVEAITKRGSRTVQSPVYGVSSGVEWDPKRKLLWHVSSRGGVHAMRLDPKGLQPLAPPPPDKE